jgi:hypothetical protein
MRNKVSIWAVGALTSVAVLGFVACSGDNDSTLDDEEGAGGNASTTTANGGSTTTATTGVGGFTTGVGGTGQGGSCVDLVFEGEQIIKPADIIIVIDNSGSMSQEINSVEQNINVNFAQILAASQVDYQVIMVTNHGTGSYDVCIGPPLSGTTNCSGPPIEIPGQFYHYDVDIQSWDAPCSLLDTLYGSAAGGRPAQAASNPNGLYNNGYNAFLRTEAVKIFLAITDDRVNCTCPGTYCPSPALSGTTLNDNNDTSGSSTGQAANMAVTFDQKLLGLAPAQFGSVAERNYIFHSIIGVDKKANPSDPYQAFEPFQATKCVTDAVNVGPGYQWLSKGTGGLRFPICQYASFDAVFQEIAAGVVEGAAVPCEFVIPDPGNGQTLDLATLRVEYTPGGTGTPQLFDPVASSAACGLNDAAFYIEDDVIHLCPEACKKVTADQNAGVKVIAQCGGIAQ